MTISFKGDSANVELWYEQLKAFTSPSSLLPISEDERRAIEYQTFQRILDFDPYYGEMHDAPMKPNGDIGAILEGITKKIDQIISNQSVFFRINLCSPKDAGENCIISNGEEALDLLLSSFRIYNGYKRVMKNKPIFLVMRELRSFEDEYRCFIENGKLIAISQYEDSDTVTKGSGASRLFALTSETILNLWRYVENVIESIGIVDAVLDVGNVKGAGFECIEINPFADCTDKCLYAGEDLYGNIQGQSFRYWFDTNILRTVEIEKNQIVAEWDELIEAEAMNDNMFQLLKNRIRET